MGRSITPTYALYEYIPGHSVTPSAWSCKHQGKPTSDNLVRAIAMFEQSTQEGGCNAHLGPTIVHSAKIVRQSTGEVVARYLDPRSL